MDPYYLSPGSSIKVYWPTVDNPSVMQDPQRLPYIRTHIQNNSTEEYKRVAWVYDHFVSTTATALEEASDIDTLKIKHAALIANIKQTSKTSEEEIKRTEDAQKKSLIEFTVLFNVDGDGPDALKAIAKYMNEYVDDNISFCIDSVKTSSNLTQFGDDMACLLVTLETLWGINTAHKDTILLFFKQLYVYSVSPFNCHTANFGPGMAGKSFGFITVMKWLIYGTFMNTTYSSAKSNAVPGHKTRCMIRFYEDVFPAFLGVVSGSKGKDTSNTEDEAIVKAWLTSGRISAHVMDTTYGRANAVSVELTSKCESVINLCSNTTSNSVPHAMRSRYHTNSWQMKQRLEGGGLLGKANKSVSPELIEAQETFKLKMRRNQALSCIIFQLVYIGILPEIDMTVARMIFTQTLEKAGKAGLSATEDVRNFERLEMVCKVLVVWDAINILWDSPDSCLAAYSDGKKIPHDYAHFILVARFLRSNVEHATMALGLMSNQYEDPIIDTILQDLRETKFKVGSKQKAIKPKGKVTLLYEPTEVTEDIDYFIATFDENSRGKNARIDNNQDRAKLLADYQFGSMTNKPLFDDVLHAYQRLLEKQVESAVINVTGESKRIPALDFREGKVFLSKHIVKEHRENALKKCTEEVIDHFYASAGEYVYGTTRQYSPFLYETIKVGSDPKKKREKLTVIDPNFFDASLVSMTQNYLKGAQKVSTNSKKRKSYELLVDDDEYESKGYSLKNAFSSNHTFIVDTDFNWQADNSFLAKHYFSESQLNDLPSGDPWERAKRNTEHTEQTTKEKLSNYPLALPHHNPKRYRRLQIEEVRDHPERFSLKAHTIRLQKMKEAYLNNEMFIEEETEQEQLENAYEEDDDEEFPNEDDDDNEDDEDLENRANMDIEGVSEFHDPAAESEEHIQREGGLDSNQNTMDEKDPNMEYDPVLYNQHIDQDVLNDAAAQLSVYEREANDDMGY